MSPVACCQPAPFAMVPKRLAAALRLQLPNEPRRTIVCVYPEFNAMEKLEVDQVIESMCPCSMYPEDILRGDYDDDIWSLEYMVSRM